MEKELCIIWVANGPLSNVHTAIQSSWSGSRSIRSLLAKHSLHLCEGGLTYTMAPNLATASAANGKAVMRLKTACYNLERLLHL